MKWERRADLEKDMVSFNGGAHIIGRKRFAEFLGRHQSDKKVSAYLNKVKQAGHMIDGKYPVSDLSDIVWQTRA